MLLPFVLVIVLAILIGVLVGTGIIMTIAKRAGIRFKVVIIIICAVGFFAASAINGKVVYICEEGDCSKKVAFGNPNYEMDDGSKIDLTGGDPTLVVNNSDDTLVVIPIFYSVSGNGGGDYLPGFILPRSKYSHSSFSIDYFFEDSPPDEIEVSNSGNSTVKYWVTKLSDDI